MMYKSRGVNRNRINDVLDKQLERSSPSTSKGFTASKNKEKEMMGKKALDRRDSPSKNINEVSDTDSEGSDVSGSEAEDVSWISWFCNLRGNEFFSEVDVDYIQDDFNLCGLSSQVPYYDYALDMILDIDSSNSDMFTEEQNELVESAAEMLYGLIHARYILTSKGLNAMLEKYKSYDFGRCPRVYCAGQPCLPVGQIDIPRSSTVKIYCPKCEDVYYPRSKYQGDQFWETNGLLKDAIFLCNRALSRSLSGSQLGNRSLHKQSPLENCFGLRDTLVGSQLSADCTRKLNF